MVRRLLLLAVLAASACAPSINPQMKSATDGLLASTRGGHSVSAPGAYAPMDWAEGQWLLMRMTDSKGQPSVLRMSVVAREADGLWLEYDTQDYQRRSVSKMLYARQPRNADEAVDLLRKMVTRAENGEVQTFDFTDESNPGMVFAKRMMKSSVQGVAAPEIIDSSTRESVTVAAGRFEGCARYVTEMAIGPVRDRSTTWFHPAVPLNGVVKAVSAENSWTMELLDYGMTGAQSSL